MNESTLDKPINILILAIIIIAVNIISSVHFMPIMLCGLMLFLTIRCLEKQYYYSLFILIVAFVMIEHSIGLIPLSLFLLSFFIYIFTLEYFKNTFSSPLLIKSALISFFYFILFIVFIFLNGFDFKLISIILINILIDIALTGVFFEI